MNRVLAVDTATKRLNIAVKNGTEIYSKSINEGFAHSENIIPTIDELLNRAGITLKDIELFICTRGPGSFTGLRIGMATLKGFATALNIPLVSIPTLDVYSKNIDRSIVLPVIDARKRSFFTAIYKDGQRETDFLDINPIEITELTKSYSEIYLTGDDAKILYDRLEDSSNFILDDIERDYSSILIDMGVEWYQGNGADSISQGPLYIRKSEAEIDLERRLAENQ